MPAPTTDPTFQTSPTDLPPLPAQARAALERGDIIDAIKHVREASALGLKEARDLVEQHRAQAGPAARAYMDTGVPSSVGASERDTLTPATLPAGIDAHALPPDVLEALDRGRKIEAIQRLRARTHMDLATAKDVIEAAEQQLRPRPRHAPETPSPGQVNSGGSGRWIAAVLVLAALLGWWFSR